MKFVLLLLAFVSFIMAQNTPEPFGLKLGVSTKEETLQVIKKEGGRVVDSGYRIIKGDIVNPNIEGVGVKGLPVDGLQSATFWFFEGKLFKIDYIFPFNMYSGDFEVLYEHLKLKYGDPTQVSRGIDENIEWDFGELRITLTDRFFETILIYEHVPLSKRADQSDQEVFKRETSKPKRGL